MPNLDQYSLETLTAVGLMNDEEAIAEVLAGNKNEYRHIVSRYKDKIFAVLMRQTGNRDIAEELAQETFIKAYRGLKSFRAESSLSTWLIRIALNCSHSYFNSKKFKSHQRNQEFDAQKHSGQSESPQEHMEREERLSRFRICLAKLKPSYREVITICALEERSYEEAAHISSIPIGTVRSRLNTARLKLKDCMQRALLN